MRETLICILITIGGIGLLLLAAEGEVNYQKQVKAAKTLSGVK